MTAKYHAVSVSQKKRPSGTSAQRNSRRETLSNCIYVNCTAANASSRLALNWLKRIPPCYQSRHFHPAKTRDLEKIAESSIIVSVVATQFRIPNSAAAKSFNRTIIYISRKHDKRSARYPLERAASLREAASINAALIVAPCRDAPISPLAIRWWRDQKVRSLK